MLMHQSLGHLRCRAETDCEPKVARLNWLGTPSGIGMGGQPASLQEHVNTEELEDSSPNSVNIEVSVEDVQFYDSCIAFVSPSFLQPDEQVAEAKTKGIAYCNDLY